MAFVLGVVLGVELGVVLKGVVLKGVKLKGVVLKGVDNLTVVLRLSLLEFRFCLQRTVFQRSSLASLCPSQWTNV